MGTKQGTNWLIFQKSESSVPTEFTELIWIDGQLIRRRGAVETWGESETVPTGPDLDEVVAKERAELEAAGFSLVREWRFDPVTFDFDLLQRELEEATRLLLSRLRMDHGGVNAFAIHTDGSVMTIGPVSNHFDSLADADDDILFIPDEWEIWEGGPLYDVVYRLILSQHRDDLTRVDFAVYAEGFFGAATRALLNLDKQGLFGERENRLLMVHASDSEPDAQSFRALNSPTIFERWQAWK